MKNILFYKYVEIKDPEAFSKNHLKLCKSLELLGKILVAKEGINGCISGSEKAIERYKKELTSDKRFSDIVFKEGHINKHTFKKMFVRPRKEIITTTWPSKLTQKAPYVEPKELKKWLDNKEDLVMVDVRNLYESTIGKFENAIPASMNTFREWKDAVKKLKKYKNKKIITYCTGGIRCEKASSYLLKQGFVNVFQLHGGILTYGKEVGNSHWQGKCFVFDERIAIDIDPKNESKPITHCIHCRLPCSAYHNCAYTRCDKLFICCNQCIKELEHCCSKNCRNILKREEKNEKIAVY